MQQKIIQKLYKQHIEQWHPLANLGELFVFNDFGRGSLKNGEKMGRKIHQNSSIYCVRSI